MTAQIMILCLALIAATATANATGRESGGGDLECDAKIQSIAGNIQTWLENKGDQSGQTLDLSSSLNPKTQKPFTFSQYESSMLELQAKPIDANCVRPGDIGYPVHVGNSAKICVTSTDETRIHMTCDRELFMNLNDDERIQQIHHELAINVDGLEPDSGETSTYRISIQLSAFTQDVNEKKLVVMPDEGYGEKAPKLSMSAAPNMSYFLPGASTSCVDWSNYKKRFRNSNDPSGTVLEASVRALRISLPQFSLTWNSDDHLYISYIRLTINSIFIKGGKFETDIKGEELAALLGSSSNSFNGKASMQNSFDLKFNPQATGTIYSNDPARDCSPGGKNIFSGEKCTFYPKIFSTDYAACGLEAGGVELDSSKADEFTGSYMMELIGYSVDENFNEIPLHAEATGSARYAGFQ